MKKRLKKWATVLICAWNLYMPNEMQQQETPIQSQQIMPVVEEVIIEDFTDEFVDSGEQSRVKRRVVLKRIFSFVPSVLWALFSMLGGILKYPLLFILGFLILLFLGWLLLRNKPWASLLGIAVGSSLVYVDIQDANRIIEEAYLGVFLIVYFVIVFVVSIKFRKEKIIIENV